jgi:hypothetical protein
MNRNFEKSVRALSVTIFCTLCGLALVWVLSANAETGVQTSPPVLPKFNEQIRLQASDAAPGDNFGYHLALSADGDTVAVGAYARSCPTGGAAGGVYIYFRSGDTWIEQARFVGSDTTAEDRFGLVVALSADGNTLAVGAPTASNSGGASAGKVYIFTRTGGVWSEQAKLQASDPGAGFRFGVVALSKDGNTLAVGSWLAENSGGSSAGSTYVFARSGSSWIQQAQLQASDGSPNAFFGVSTALSYDGNTLAVSAYGATNSGGSNAGNAYVFTRSNGVWAQQARLQSSDAAADAIFGTRIALSADGNTLSTGAYHAANSGGALAGNAYVFTRSGQLWTEQARLQASDAAAGDAFGTSTSLSSDGNLLAVGAYAKNSSGKEDAGGAYIFRRTGDVWTEQERLQASDAGQRDYFGLRVDLSANGHALAVSAYGDNNSGGDGAGSVYIFSAAPSKNLDSPVLDFDKKSDQ